MERLFQYLFTHKDYGIRYYASNMQLQGQSDVFYLSRLRAKSVCGGLFYLGSRNAINGPIVCTSKMISCVVASAAEAELAAGFQQAQLAVRLRHRLHDLDYPVVTLTMPLRSSHCTSCTSAIAKEERSAKQSGNRKVKLFSHRW
jgi:hypothetical protein